MTPSRATLERAHYRVGSYPQGGYYLAKPDGTYAYSRSEASLWAVARHHYRAAELARVSGA